MYFALILKDTASVSQYIISLSVFITEAEMVYCAVRPEYLNAVNVILIIEEVSKLQTTELRMLCTATISTSRLVTF
jgi:hypothetical protein